MMMVVVAECKEEKERERKSMTSAIRIYRDLQVEKPGNCFSPPDPKAEADSAG